MEKKIAKLSALAALALAAVPMAAQAQTNSVEVSYKDLDLTRAEHQALLDRRIAGAVTKVCGRTSPLTLSLNNEITACRTAAFQSAQNDVRVAMARADQSRALASNDAPVVGN